MNQLLIFIPTSKTQISLFFLIQYPVQVALAASTSYHLHFLPAIYSVHTFWTSFAQLPNAAPEPSPHQEAAPSQHPTRTHPRPSTPSSPSPL